MSAFRLTGKKWCPGAESNHRHADFQSENCYLDSFGCIALYDTQTPDVNGIIVIPLEYPLGPVMMLVAYPVLTWA